MTAPGSIVIVGAGQTGAVAARTLRELGYAGALTLVGDETHLPYERPPLSKEALGAGVDGGVGRMHSLQYYADQGIELIAGATARALDRERRQVVLSDGRCLDYDACLLATGGRARRLPLLPESLPNVHVLRTLDDAMALGAALAPGVRLAVIGGGFLGLEAAWTAMQRGVAVTVVEGAPALLGRVLPPELSDWLLQRARGLGLDVRLGVSTTGAVPAATAAAGTTLALSAGGQVEADQILVAIGLVPNTELAVSAGLPLCEATAGVLVDADCRTADPYVWAAGDCASQCRAPDGQPVRMESWQNANTHGALAAASMLQAARPAAPYPWFWTDQLGCNIQILGAPQPGLDYVVRGAARPGDDAPKLLCLGLRDGVPVHGVAINAGGDLRALRALFEQAAAIDPAAFADPATALKPFVKSCLQRSA
ncbi:NAD(P)/FAD-dependent oxidoreductase [Bordetella genomosp. 13]|uniref:NAD(P)/FAD-dependent oxidoreductase n=1 Tax=Bordetella genomosp. 13 TaxID=463040 RepID=UPI0011A7E3B6|nr:FAD-dependent oxidoreductase [Bordetella genomosp. 13]